MVERRSHAGAAVILATLSGFGTGDSTFVATGTPLGWPDGSDGPFSIRVGKGLPNEEKLYIVSRTSDTFTIAGHGYDDTGEQDHGPGETVELVGTALELDEANAHIMADNGVHGLGAGVKVVGDTTAQTLRNKAMDGGSNAFTNIPRTASPQLSGDTTVVATGLAAELTARAAGDATNAAAIATEAASRASADTAIIATATAEAVTRAAADTTNATAITTEATARAAADALLAPKASPTFTGTVTLPGDPAAALQASTKQYTDARDGKWGAFTGTPDANGNITIAHGLGVTPTSVFMQVLGPSTNITPALSGAQVRSMDGTNINAHVYDTTFAAFHASPVTVYWLALP